MASREAVREVKRKHSAQLLQQPGVCGVGVEKDENGEYVLTVHLDAEAADAARNIPAQLEGCPVKVIRSGPFRRFSDKSGDTP
jgi:hypothetical protein